MAEMPVPIRNRWSRISAVAVIVTVAVALTVNLAISLYSVTVEFADVQQDVATQIAKTFDITLAQIEDSVFSAALDANLVALTEAYESLSPTQLFNLFGALRTIQLRNRYVSEVNLLFPASQHVLVGTIGVVQNLRDYADAEAIVEYARTSAVTIPPRRAVLYDHEGLFMTMFAPVPLIVRDAKAIIIAYVNTQYMFQEIVRRVGTSVGPGISVHVVDHGQIILSTDSTRMSTAFQRAELAPTTAVRRLFAGLTGRTLQSFAISASSRLRWTFVIESPTGVTRGAARAVRYSSVVGIVLVGIASVFTRRWFRSTRVYERAYVRSLWAQYLSDPNADPPTGAQLPGHAFVPGRHLCAVVAVETLQDGISQTDVLVGVERVMESWDGLVAHLLVPTTPRRIDVVIVVEGFEVATVVEEFARFLNSHMSETVGTTCYTAVSSLMQSLEALPIAHRECTEALEYKLLARGNHLRYPDVRARIDRKTYPFDIETRLLNNLSLGNQEECLRQVDAFFAYLQDSAYRVSDPNHRAFVTQLCANAQRNAYARAGLGAPAAEISTDETDSDRLLETVRDYVVSLVRHSQEADSSLAIDDEIMHFIDANLTDPNLNLNHVAYSLDLHRNQVSKVVQRVTGTHFTAYLHKLRVEHAKQLLMDADSTVAKVSEESGFSYTHHFIRVFKSLEGVTPGQFHQIALDRAASG